QRPGARQAGGEQRVLVRGARCANGGDDTAAVARDLLVTGALQALLEFGGTVAGEDQVRVAVDEGWRHQRARGRIDLLCKHAWRAWQIRAAACKGDAAVAPGQRAVVDDVVAA